MISKPYASTLILTIAILCGFCNGEIQAEDAGKSVGVSPKCAAALLSGGALGGAGFAYALIPAALCTAGFCPAGVSGASFASWWQSSMPLVQTGGLFATLQSVAMGGVGTKVVVTGSMLGGTLSMKYLDELCTYVDDPNSRMAPFFDASLEAVRGANLAADKAKAACSSSVSCTAAADLAQAASATISSSVSSIWNYISDSVGQTADAISNKTELWSLEKEVVMLKEQIKDLKENTYSGRVIEQTRHYHWSHGYLNWLSGGIVESIFTLEKKLDENEARLLELKQSNE
mmetsp:Transcript_28972/g.47525  ORF Transcript_28972/g.47525 Transcript_28972/m.47525 type:complete len:288 (-) Transcript_28972:52-915(-)|eukprot:CAMPEP_0201980178 /NCGR_PEP_ID=MMETSP0904-20121228/69571_1 /ASSEMBLY_ACC=CAM_ASM_000553 /TAXON_ID=420261 /ORGANISM="Thalassiosira antarctica, Strain CCMP982" /LENGTH=287 /DNA_ID=CAMNT_0048532385 /DNA_START=95 /DNA_END=958 /DNA_ORIENTATION=-